MIIDKDEMKKLLEDGYTIEQLAAYFKCSTTTIKRRKKEYGLLGIKTNKKPITEEELATIVKLSKENYGLKDISIKLNINTHRLLKYLSKELYTKLVNNSKASLGNNLRIGSLKNVFTANNYSAYIIGYLQADGCITKDGYITATSKDLELIYYCTKFFLCNTLKEGRYFKFSLKDYKNIETFKKITGLTPNKTYTGYSIPEWILNNDIYLQYFIVGLFNGDGWVTKVDNHRVELGIEQHISQSNFLKTINTFLGWNYYESGNTCKIQSKKKEVIREFASIYLFNEFSLSRKKQIISSCEDIV